MIKHQARLGIYPARTKLNEAVSSQLRKYPRDSRIRYWAIENGPGASYQVPSWAARPVADNRIFFCVWGAKDCFAAQADKKSRKDTFH